VSDCVDRVDRLQSDSPVMQARQRMGACEHDGHTRAECQSRSGSANVSFLHESINV